MNSQMPARLRKAMIYRQAENQIVLPVEPTQTGSNVAKNYSPQGQELSGEDESKSQNSRDAGGVHGSPGSKGNIATEKVVKETEFLSLQSEIQELQRSEDQCRELSDLAKIKIKEADESSRDRLVPTAAEPSLSLSPGQISIQDIVQEIKPPIGQGHLISSESVSSTLQDVELCQFLNLFNETMRMVQNKLLELESEECQEPGSGLNDENVQEITGSILGGEISQSGPNIQSEDAGVVHFQSGEHDQEAKTGEKHSSRNEVFRLVDYEDTDSSDSVSDLNANQGNEPMANKRRVISSESAKTESGKAKVIYQEEYFQEESSPKDPYCATSTIGKNIDEVCSTSTGEAAQAIKDEETGKASKDDKNINQSRETQIVGEVTCGTSEMAEVFKEKLITDDDIPQMFHPSGSQSQQSCQVLQDSGTIAQIPQAKDLPQMAVKPMDVNSTVQATSASINPDYVCIACEVTSQFAGEEIEIAQFLEATAAQNLSQDEHHQVDLEHQDSHNLSSIINTFTEQELEIARFLGRISQSFHHPSTRSDNRDLRNISTNGEGSASRSSELQDEALNVIDDSTTPKFLSTFSEQEMEVARFLAELKLRKFYQENP